MCVGALGDAVTVAVCFNCGAMKFGAYTQCAECNKRPATEDDFAWSLGCSDQYLPVHDLEAISRDMRNGVRPQLSPKSLAALMPAARDAVRMLGPLIDAAPPESPGSPAVPPKHNRLASPREHKQMAEEMRAWAESEPNPTVRADLLRMAGLSEHFGRNNAPGGTSTAAYSESRRSVPNQRNWLSILLRKGGIAYMQAGALLSTIMWLSYLWPVTWGAPAHLGFFQQAIGIFVIQPVAVFSAAIRLFLWGPSLAMWLISPQSYSFGEWLAPGFYSVAG